MLNQIKQPLGATGMVAVINLDTLEGWMQFACTVAALLWWVRLWWNNPRKKPPTAPCIALLAVLAFSSGCARFGTRQSDISRYDGTNELREVTTRSGGYTFFSGKNNLARWSAFQSDKTQKAGIEGLSQQSAMAEELNALAKVLEEIRKATSPAAAAAK